MHRCNCFLLQLLGGGEGEWLCYGVAGVCRQGEATVLQLPNNQIKCVSKVLGQMWALLALRGVPGLLRHILLYDGSAQQVPQ